MGQGAERQPPAIRVSKDMPSAPLRRAKYSISAAGWASHHARPNALQAMLEDARSQSYGGNQGTDLGGFLGHPHGAPPEPDGAEGTDSRVW